MTDWQETMYGDEGIASEGEGLGAVLTAWAGSDEQHQQKSYLEELTESYRTMSADVMGTRAKTFSDKTRMRNVAGKTNLVGSGTINRASRKMDVGHQESVWDSYSSFLEDKSGIISDIAGARQDWWDFNQDVVNSALLAEGDED